MKDVFNFPDNDIKAFKAYLNKSKEKDYYSDNYYYFYNNCEMGGWSVEYIISIISAKKVDGYYYIEYKAQEEYSTKKEPFYCLLKYKTHNGTNYWSLYKNSKTKFSTIDVTTKSNNNNNKEGGNLNIKSDNLNEQKLIAESSVNELEDKEMNLSEASGGVTISSVNDDLIATPAEVEEKDTTSSASGGKTNTTLIIIITAVVVALLIAAFIFIILKNNKKKTQISEAEAVKETPSENESAPVTAPLPVAEEVVPPPTPKIEYSCKDMGVGGKCAMCKKEAETLYLINAKKGEKQQKATVCKDCAGKVIAKFKSQNQ